MVTDLESANEQEPTEHSPGVDENKRELCSGGLTPDKWLERLVEYASRRRAAKDACNCQSGNGPSAKQASTSSDTLAVAKPMHVSAAP